MVDATARVDPGYLVDLVYEKWWNDLGHVCATYRCEDCLENARTAVEFVLRISDDDPLLRKPTDEGSFDG